MRVASQGYQECRQKADIGIQQPLLLEASTTSRAERSAFFAVHDQRHLLKIKPGRKNSARERQRAPKMSQAMIAQAKANKAAQEA